MSDYDYQSYEKCLEQILKSTQRDYWAQYIDINRHQVAVGRTYLWVAAALIGAYAAGYQEFEYFSLNALAFVVFILAFSLSVIAFGICLYAIPARKGYQSVHKEGWGEFSHVAYNLLCEKKENIYAVFLTDFISKFDIAHKYSSETNQKRAKFLRLTSWLLIISFILAITSFVSISSHNRNLESQKEESMTESNNKPTGSDTEPSPVNTDKPNVPIPPPPAGSQGGQLHTHTDDSPDVIRLTEDVDSKKEE